MLVLGPSYPNTIIPEGSVHSVLTDGQEFHTFLSHKQECLETISVSGLFPGEEGGHAPLIRSPELVDTCLSRLVELPRSQTKNKIRMSLGETGVEPTQKCFKVPEGSYKFS